MQARWIEIWRVCERVWGARTRVCGQVASVDGQCDVESVLRGGNQMRTIDLLQTSLQTVLADGGEGGSLQRQIQGRLILNRGPKVEDNTIKVGTGHLDGSGFSSCSNKQG